MTALPNDNNPTETPTPAPSTTLPSAFDILLFSATLTKRHAGELYGFAGYLFFPLLLLFGVQGLTGTVGLIASGAVNALIVGLSCWSAAAIMTTISYRTTHPDKTPDPRSVGTHALRVLPWLAATALLSGIIQLAGYVLLIVPGIIASIFLTFAAEEVVLAGHGPLAALAASRERVQKQFLPIAGRLLTIVLLAIILYTVFGSILVSLASALTNGTLQSLMIGQTPLWLDILLFVLQILLFPVIVTAHTVLYLSAGSAPTSKETAEKQS